MSNNTHFDLTIPVPFSDSDEDSGLNRIGTASLNSDGYLSIRLFAYPTLPTVITGILPKHTSTHTPVLSDEEMDIQLQHLITEIHRAEIKMSEHNGYIGVNFFVTKWQSPHLISDIIIRRKLIDEAVKKGLIELYDAGDTDTVKAIRCIEEDDT